MSNDKTLIIVESPNKEKTIEKFTNIKVLSTKGHIAYLPKNPKGVYCNEDNDFLFEWKIDNKKIKNILDSIDNYDLIILAMDSDREGEGICNHLELVLKKNNYNREIKRALFYEITKESILKSLNCLTTINRNAVDSYLARVWEDFRLGFDGSPLLWTFRSLGTLSFGRVQSPLLKIIIDREKEIIKFIPKKYFTITGYYQNNKIKLNKYKGNKIEDIEEEEIKEIINKNINKEFKVIKSNVRKINIKPDAPYITSSLQQDIYNKFGYNLNNISKILQELYEGIKIGEETISLITYIRTDSYRISNEFSNKLKEYIKKEYPGYLAEDIIQHKDASDSQGAHECIRVIYLDYTPERIKPLVSEEIYNIYDLIWKRTLATHFKNSINETYNYTFTNEETEFKYTNSIKIYDGFYKIIGLPEEEETLIIEKEKIKFDKIEYQELYTKAPNRYTVSTAIEEMVKNKIGRPSTYSSIIYILIYRRYIIIKEKKIWITFKGVLVGLFLCEYMKEYMSPNQTAIMELNLDLIANGLKNWKEVLKEFYTKLKLDINKFKSILTEEKIKTLKERLKDHYGNKCSDCNEDIVILVGKKNAIFCSCKKKIY